MQIIEESDKKSFRKCSYLLKALRNVKNYLIPETIEDLKTLGLGPTIKIQNKQCWLGEKALSNLRQLVDLLYHNEEIRHTLSYNTVFNCVLNVIQADIDRKIVAKKEEPIDVILAEISNSLLQERHNYTIFHVVIGLELPDFDSFEIGNVELLKFTATRKEALLKGFPKETTDEKNRLYSKFIDDNYLNKTCFKYRIFADIETAQRIVKTRLREILNYFRFVICFLSYDIIHRNPIKIRLSGEYISEGENLLSVTGQHRYPIIGWKMGRQNLEPFPLTNNRLTELRSRLFFDDFISWLEADDITELEGAIITAIFWAGEAQDEFDNDISFLKFWTALESIFTIDRAEIVDNLAKGTAVLITFSGYKFVNIEDYETILQSLKKMYSTRSKMIHRGIRYKVTPRELSDICKYTCWTIAGLFSLRSKGYSNFGQVKREIERLHGIIMPAHENMTT